MLRNLIFVFFILAYDSWRTEARFYERHHGNPHNYTFCTRPVPTFHKPFFFFHIDKTSGSTFEEELFRSLRRSKVSFLITCRDGLPCWPNQLSNQTTCPYSTLNHYGPILCEFHERACSSVFAGHFMPDLVDALAKYNSMAHAHSAEQVCNAGQKGLGSSRWQKGANPEYDCVTFLREPLDRSISWYQDKKIDRGILTTKFINLTMSERIEILQSNFVGGHQTAWLSDVDWSNETNADFALAKAKEMVDRCVVGIYEKLDETNELINATFPWIRMPAASSAPHIHPSSHMSPADLSPTEQEQLRSVLQPDLALYQYALRQFNLQWHYYSRAKETGHVNEPC